jgi:radical SAM protein with 4Fe4S-binding SPASM domain
MKPVALRKVVRKPRHAIWEITAACNLRCLHCESRAGLRRNDELTTQEALALCDALAAAGCNQCNVSGGEPLMRKDWAQLCGRLSGHGVRVTVVTNGVLFDDDAAHTARDSGVSAVAVSLDGMRDTHDRIRPSHGVADSSFREVVRAIGTAQNAGLVPAVITHINRWNLGELGAVHALLRQLGVDWWQVQLGLPLGRQREIREPYMLAPEQLGELAHAIATLIRGGGSPRLRVTDTIGYYTRLEPVLRGGTGHGIWTGCYAGILAVAIDCNGDVKGCSCLPKQFVAGNVRERPFGQIWDDERGFAYNTDWHEERLTGECARCAYRRVCRAGCTSLAWSVTGSIYENPYCLHRLSMIAADGRG